MNRELSANTTLSHYRIVSKIGAGGMGEVYLAEDTRLDRRVALKLLPPNLTSDEQAKKRLLREAKSAATLDHPNICAIYEVGEEDGRNFIAMQFVEGETLASRIERNPLDIRVALDIADQVAEALAAAHSRGIVHRDIKPQNIMITPHGHVRVMDFGLAKAATSEMSTDSGAETQSLLTEPGMILGTVPYMSPEQVRGEPLDARSDVFSFGTVMHEMISGHHPFAAQNPATTMSAILTREAPLLGRSLRDAPQELERIVAKALRKNREERYQVIKDLSLDLKSLRDELKFASKLERSASPDATAAPRVEARGINAFDNAGQAVAPTHEIEAAHTPSTARDLVGKIKRHKAAAAVSLTIVIAAAAGLFFYFNQPAALTEKDTILLADFVNTTGDAVFDVALKQGLAMQLEQSPFLNIFSEERVRETMRLMGRSPDERVMKDIARDICQRQGLKAYLAGSISNLGSHYIISLEAVNAQTGDTLARQQVEAESKEQVLRTLGHAATELREKLGESLSSIQKYDALIEQATTSSLEALKAVSLAKEANLRGNYPESVKYANRAVELDPDFARAYNLLAVAYYVMGQSELASKFAQKAFELRERASERERLLISSHYYDMVSGEVDKSIEALELLKQIYPRYSTAHNQLGNGYSSIGQFEKAIEEFRHSILLSPGTAVSYSNLANALIRLNRFDEAKGVFEQALAQKLDIRAYRAGLYSIAFINGDAQAMKRQIEWANAKLDEYVHLNWQAETTAFAGHLRESNEFSNRAIDVAQRHNLRENAANIASAQAVRSALVGNCQQAKEGASRGLVLAHTNTSLRNGAIALALCGETGQSQSLSDEISKRFPKGTLEQAIWLPAIRATIEMRRGKSSQAIQLLEAAIPYGGGGLSWPQHLRGHAHLSRGAGAEAAAQFQEILDRRGLAPTSVLYPLAHLGLARAAALAGDTSKSRKAYQDFFVLWKEADADIPILIEAKVEYNRLK